jgi:hypothetical protein
MLQALTLWKPQVRRQRHKTSQTGATHQLTLYCKLKLVKKRPNDQHSADVCQPLESAALLLSIARSTSSTSHCTYLTATGENQACQTAQNFEHKQLISKQHQVGCS